jgi:hypothetical protein
MKIRRGFVSNSSSSSFVIALDKKPESAEELQEILFGDRQEYPDPYSNDYWPASEVAETVFNDINNQKPMTKKGVIKEVSTGWFPGKPDFHEFREEPGSLKIKWEEYEKAVKEAAAEASSKFLEESKGKVLFNLHYGDGDGPYYSALEHGILFDNILSMKISHH